MKHTMIACLVLASTMAGCASDQPLVLEPTTAELIHGEPGKGGVTSECGGSTDLLDSQIDLECGER